MIIPKSLKGNKRKYFTQETEDAIIKYNQETDPIKRSIIYEKYIHYAFFKLTQNIIHTFKFYNTDVYQLEHLQHEIIIFLLSKMDKFNPDKGYKAYSYFSIITKNWLIHYTRANYKNKINKKDIDELNDENNFYQYDEEQIELEEGLEIYLDKYIKFVSSNIYKLFPKNNDAKVADAILELFRKRYDLDEYNKKKLYMYIREQIDVKTPKITKISKKLKNLFEYYYNNYLNDGHVNFDLQESIIVINDKTI